VSGIDKRAYWLSFYMFDIVVSYIPCILTHYLFGVFGLQYKHVWKVLMAYPWAIVPYSYITSYVFTREATAMTFTIYWHFLLAGIAGMIVFALRMVEPTAFWGDKIMTIMRFVNPTYNLCNAIIFASVKSDLSNRRSDIIDELKKKY